MCSHYTALKKQEQLEKFFRTRGIPLPKSDMWPRHAGVFVRRPPEHDSGDEAVPEREAVVRLWELISGTTSRHDPDGSICTNATGSYIVPMASNTTAALYRYA